MFSLPNGNFPKVMVGLLRGRRLQQGPSAAVKMGQGPSAAVKMGQGPCAAVIADLESCCLGNFTFGKLPFGKIPLGICRIESCTLENTLGKMTLGKVPINYTLLSFLYRSVYNDLKVIRLVTICSKNIYKLHFCKIIEYFLKF